MQMVVCMQMITFCATRGLNEVRIICSRFAVLERAPKNPSDSASFDERYFSFVQNSKQFQKTEYWLCKSYEKVNLVLNYHFYSCKNYIIHIHSHVIWFIAFAICIFLHHFLFQFEKCWSENCVIYGIYRNNSERKLNNFPVSNIPLPPFDGFNALHLNSHASEEWKRNKKLTLEFSLDATHRHEIWTKSLAF